MKSIRPKIIVSKCLGFEKCRYNGDMEKAEFIQKLHPFVDIETICPETAIGLETPRQAIRLVEQDQKIRLVQPKTGIDLTNQMYEFAQEYLLTAKDVDGFILKSRSPSCGIKDVKVYSSAEKGSQSSKGMGIFSSAIKEQFPEVLLEDEGRLSNYTIREHFLTKLFLTAEFKEIKKALDFNELCSFHKENYLLYLTYSPEATDQLEQLMETNPSSPGADFFNQYQNILHDLLLKQQKKENKLYVLNYCLEQLPMIQEQERLFIQEKIDQYAQGTTPYAVPLSLVELQGIRFNSTPLSNQRLFCPYPKELIEVRDSGKLIQ